MGVEDLIIGKMLDESDSCRSVLEVPYELVFRDFQNDDLVERARRRGIVNQLGVIVDLTCAYIVNENNPKYAQLSELSRTLYGFRVDGEMSFYDEDRVITQVKKSRLEKMTEPSELEILRKWGVIAVLSPSKFKEVYDQYAKDKQAASIGYSS